jgi:hypothetical protein
MFDNAARRRTRLPLTGQSVEAGQHPAIERNNAFTAVIAIVTAPTIANLVFRDVLAGFRRVNGLLAPGTTNKDTRLPELLAP